MVRIVFEAPDGAIIELPADQADFDRPVRPLEPVNTSPRTNVIERAEIAVWNEFEAGATTVHITSPAGAGATTLLHALRANSPAHGFQDGTLFITASDGSIGDVTQRLLALAAPQAGARFFTVADSVQICDRRRILVFLDDAELLSADVAELGKNFPAFCFVVVNSALPLTRTSTVALGPVRDDQLRELLEDVCGQQIEVDNFRVARELCASVGSLPGPSRLIGIAARELERSFISLYAEYGSGEEIIRALIQNLTEPQRRVLEILRAAGAPMAAHHIAYLARSGNIHAGLCKLAACELVRVCGSEMYDVPRYVERLARPETRPNAAAARVIDVFCDVFDSWPAVPIYDRQLTAAEELIRNASEDERWLDVLTLGPRLAQMLAIGARFGAWGRILRAVENAAQHAGETAALNTARQHLSVRTKLLNEHTESATHEWATHEFVAPRAAHAMMVRSSMPARKSLALLVLCLAIVVVATVVVGLNHRPSARPRIPQFSGTRAVVAEVRSTALDGRHVRRVATLRPAIPRIAGGAIGHMRLAVFDLAHPAIALTLHPTVDDRLTRRSIYQFDATPSVLHRGQTASLCVGVGRPARGFVTHIGTLEPGITRCYRVGPRMTTVYRLYVALRTATAVRTVTVAVRSSILGRDVVSSQRR